MSNKTITINNNELTIQEYIDKEIYNSNNSDNSDNSENTHNSNLSNNDVYNVNQEELCANNNFTEENNINNENDTDVKTIQLLSNLDALKKMIKFLGIEFNELDELIGLEIDREEFLTPQIIEYYQTCKDLLRQTGYTSGKLTSLHENNICKQRFPAVNMIRQVLRCNGLWLKPRAISNGYNKSSGQKNIKRSYVIVKLN